ncbi:unnamed protein product, partial [Schistosoma spindalis]
SVPAKWIASGTMVEYEDIGTVCPEYNSSEACEKAAPSNTTCFWCEKLNACINNDDQDNHNLKVKGCRVEDVNNVSTTGPINHTESTPEIIDVQIEKNLQEISEQLNNNRIALESMKKRNNNRIPLTK